MQLWPDGFSLGYQRLDGGMIFAAATALIRSSLRPEVQDWEVYDPRRKGASH